MADNSLYSGTQGPQGIQGATGPTGPTGPTGAGVPNGGTTGQVLEKASATDQDTQWATINQVFGSEYHHAESLGESSTSSTTLQQKVQLTTASLPSGNYVIHLSCDIGTVSNNKTVLMRARLNDTGTNLMEFDSLIDGSGDLNLYITCGCTHVRNLSGVNTIDIDYAKGQGDAKIRNANITLWRVS